jgi:hypothetical protein
MKIRTLRIVVEMNTNLPITSEEVRDAMVEMVYNHDEYDRDETIYGIPRVSVVVLD